MRRSGRRKERVDRDFDAHRQRHPVCSTTTAVLFVSWHQWPLYPGSGRLAEIGSGDAIGTTVNLPVPPRTTGDLYLALIDEVVGGIIDRFGPTWLLISAGFDAHRYDPIAELGLSSGDFAAITSVLMQAVGPGRSFLEGGYDVDALEWSAAGCLAALAGVTLHPEAPTSGVFRADLAHRVAVAQGLV
jgi:acetoin utilization deacetylase AcuC-like enzyme